MASHHHQAIAALIGLASVVAACGGDVDREERLAELRSERRSLLIQFSATQNAIRRLQARALDEPGVAAQQDSFDVALRRHVATTDPEGAALLDRAASGGEELNVLSEPVLLVPGEAHEPMSADEQRRLAAELTEVERALRPVIDRAMEDPVVSARFASLRDSLVAALLRLEPSSRATLDLMAEIEGRIAATDSAIEALAD